jgi:hypothetical protein
VDILTSLVPANTTSRQLILTYLLGGVQRLEAGGFLERLEIWQKVGRGNRRGRKRGG